MFEDLAPLYPGLRLDVFISLDVTVLRLVSEKHDCHCRTCNAYSEHAHSHRDRSGFPLFWTNRLSPLRTRKFFCDNRFCSTRIFVERFDDFLAPSQIMTTRLDQLIPSNWLFLGRKSGAEMCRRLGSVSEYSIFMYSNT